MTREALKLVRGGQVFSAEVLLEVGQFSWADLAQERPLSHLASRWVDLDNQISFSLKLAVSKTGLLYLTYPYRISQCKGHIIFWTF